MMRLSSPLKIFFCYAREDKRFHKELDIRLSVFRRQNLIVTWYDQEIKPGEAWNKVINSHIDSTHIFLLM
jgi:TIR domain